MVRYEKIDIIQRIMNTDFNMNTTNLSYSELIQLINTMKDRYRDCVSGYNFVKNKENMYIKTIEDLNENIKYLEKQLEYFENSNKNLMFVITRKLTIWERITGKIKL